jgi:ABC-2 type transporter
VTVPEASAPDPGTELAPQLIARRNAPSPTPERPVTPGRHRPTSLTIWLGVYAAAFSDFITLQTCNAQLTMIVGGTASLPLLFLSSAFFPEQLQPDWLSAVGKLNPVAYVVSSGQNLLNSGVHWGHLLSTVGVLGLTAALCFTGAVRAFPFATSGAGGRPGRNRKATTVRGAAPETNRRSSPGTAQGRLFAAGVAVLPWSLRPISKATPPASATAMDTSSAIVA